MAAAVGWDIAGDGWHGATFQLMDGDGVAGQGGGTWKRWVEGSFHWCSPKYSDGSSGMVEPRIPIPNSPKKPIILK
jgi:hypothetical protein